MSAELLSRPSTMARIVVNLAFLAFLGVCVDGLREVRGISKALNVLINFAVSYAASVYWT